MFGVLSSICDEDLIRESLKTLSTICTGNALFTVASKGRFPEELGYYDELRRSGNAGPAFQEQGVIAYRSRHQRSDGTWDDFGSERYKVFDFSSLSDIASKSGWNIDTKFVVNTSPPMRLSQNWDEALQDAKRCESINSWISDNRDADLSSISQKAMHIGLLCTPQVS